MSATRCWAAARALSTPRQARKRKSPALRWSRLGLRTKPCRRGSIVQVAHYTGQEELASAIQEGLEARASGDMDAATKHLGRVAKLASDSGNDGATHRLSKVVDIVDADHGTVRLKAKVEKADEMDLDLGSTRTSRAGRKRGEQQ